MKKEWEAQMNNVVDYYFCAYEKTKSCEEIEKDLERYINHRSDIEVKRFGENPARVILKFTDTGPLELKSSMWLILHQLMERVRRNPGTTRYWFYRDRSDRPGYGIVYYP